VHAQLRAVLRHNAGARPAAEPGGILRVRALKVDIMRFEVTANHHRLDLTPTEYRILHALVKHAGRVLGADFLLQQAAGGSIKTPGAREIIKVHVARLRRKLFEATGEPDYIVNVRNVGYLLESLAQVRERAPRGFEPVAYVDQPPARCLAAHPRHVRPPRQKAALQLRSQHGAERSGSVGTPPGQYTRPRQKSARNHERPAEAGKAKQKPIAGNSVDRSRRPLGPQGRLGIQKPAPPNDAGFGLLTKPLNRSSRRGLPPRPWPAQR